MTEATEGNAFPGVSEPGDVIDKINASTVLKSVIVHPQKR
jgi:hypothetical protein